MGNVAEQDIRDDPPQAGDSVPRGRRPQTVLDMVRSLGVVVAVVLVVVLLTMRSHGNPVRTVDYRDAYDEARIGAPFTLVLPVGLGPSWRATSAYFATAGDDGYTSGTWHVGFVTPEQQYAGFEQTAGSAAGVLRQVLQEPVDEGRSVTVQGQPWRQWSDGGSDHRALVRRSSGVTVVVDGSAGWPELERLAGALRSAG